MRKLVLQGVLSSQGRHILFVDADGASNFSDLDKLERCMEEQKLKAKLLKKSKVRDLVSITRVTHLLFQMSLVRILLLSCAISLKVCK